MQSALLVRVQGERFALPLSGEQAIAELGPVTPLPHGEPLLRGLTTIQGRAVPLLDLSPLLAAEEGAGAPRLVVLTSLEGDRVALLVHEVYGVTSLPSPPPSTSLLIDMPGGPLLNAATLAREVRGHLGS
ncbi:chemotaxis protein CheW [Deinococcus sp. HMF7604]|uniref:chemotaxis protein CheW n=1 Tax=Deinococcus betulae TaxID=2873312 RepID=UPI001CCD5136|nr:chemotaxis protein CheW [Deinococcus betulae]MBZ9752468.1 chemotaxis protein CheW [Deinococcus betulae]